MVRAMTPDTLRASIKVVKNWAEGEIERLTYEGTRPVSICATVDAAIREAAIARGNRIVHSSEIAEIEELCNLCNRALDRISLDD
jgi:hypothetical protein